MPQGKMKVNAKMPVGAKVKNRISKPKDIQKRNRPAKAKKTEGNMLRSDITKAINEANETTVREKAVFDGKMMHVLPTDDVLPADKPGTSGNKKGSTQKKGNKSK